MPDAAARADTPPAPFDGGPRSPSADPALDAYDAMARLSHLILRLEPREARALAGDFGRLSALALDLAARVEEIVPVGPIRRGS
jgi:hypothetical protein